MNKESSMHKWKEERKEGKKKFVLIRGYGSRRATNESCCRLLPCMKRRRSHPLASVYNGVEKRGEEEGGARARQGVVGDREKGQVSAQLGELFPLSLAICWRLHE